eukprot:5862272-Alexandrium_andersonii.AAC.1
MLACMRTPVRARAQARVYECMQARARARLPACPVPARVHARPEAGWHDVAIEGLRMVACTRALAHACERVLAHARTCRWCSVTMELGATVREE